MSSIVEGPFATTAPAPSEHTRLCRVYGSTRDLSGNPRPFVGYTFRLQRSGRYGAVSADSFLSDKRTAVADRNGFFFVDLPRGAALLMESTQMGDPLPFCVPDQETATLSDLVFPRPERLEWFIVDGGSLLVLPQDPIGYASFAPTPESLDVALCVVWSDGQVVALEHPHYTVSGDLTATAVGSSTVRLQLPAAGTGVLVATEEAQHSGEEGGLWARAGYNPENSPVFLPPTDYRLQDPSPLTFASV